MRVALALIDLLVDLMRPRKDDEPQSPSFHYTLDLTFDEIRMLLKAAYRITPSVSRSALINKLDLAERQPGPCPVPFDWDKVDAEAKRRGPRWTYADIFGEGW